MNFLNVRRFTEAVYELFVVERLSFSEVLVILSGSENRRIKAVSRFITLELEKGSLLSEALLHCEEIRFDPVYVLFIKFAEKTGDLASVFNFLKNRCDRKKQNVQRLVEASIYPVFVIVVAIVFCILFCVYGKSMFSEFAVQDSETMVSFGKSVFFLCLFCGIVFYFFWKNMKENKLYEAFLGMGFLIKAGVNVSLAIGYGMLMVGPDSREGKLFSEAQQRLEFGMDLRSSFDFSNGGSRKFTCAGMRKVSEVFYYAQQTGSKSDLFEKVALNMKIFDEKKRKFCLCLVEPMLIAITGVFLLILLVNFLLPFMTNTKII